MPCTKYTSAIAASSGVTARPRSSYAGGDVSDEDVTIELLFFFGKSSPFDDTPLVPIVPTSVSVVSSVSTHPECSEGVAFQRQCRSCRDEQLLRGKRTPGPRTWWPAKETPRPKPPADVLFATLPRITDEALGTQTPLIAAIAIDGGAVSPTTPRIREGRQKGAF